ncbi:MAG: hypothetical protein LAT67_05125 [Balneolales bacterium]|nr:hypothetical protein [Balneolales bacterium]
MNRFESTFQEYQTNYTPSQNFIVPPGGTITKQFYPRTGNQYGFNRILVGATNTTALFMSAEINNETTIFRDVHVETVRRLFRSRTLESPFIIKASRSLSITITNVSNQEQEVTVQLAGFDDWLLKRWVEDRKNQGQRILTPAFFYGKAEVGATERGKLLNLPPRSENMIVTRMQLASNGDADIRVSLREYSSDLKQNLFLEQLNDEFDLKTALVPYRIKANWPLELVFDNRHPTQSRTVSALLEAYVHE